MHDWHMLYFPLIALDWTLVASLLIDPCVCAGDAHADVSLAYMYTHGKGVDVDYHKAFAHQLKAANAGLAIAQHNVGTNFFIGKGTPQDYEKALEFFQKAADQGFTYSEMNLANMLQQGLGAPRDLKRAEMYYESASKKNQQAVPMLEALRKKIADEEAQSQSTPKPNS
eukprot:m.365626 g.365626  ORF g.365626 m.365626 type:complete len:169 (+) comp56057_c0_seq2:146-652(+)